LLFARWTNRACPANELLGPNVYTQTTTPSVPKLLVSTFVPGRIPTWYKCGDDTFIPRGGYPRYKCGHICTKANPHTLYKCGFTGCTRAYLPHPIQIPLFVPGAKIPGTNEKSGHGQMHDSLVVFPRFTYIIMHLDIVYFYASIQLGDEGINGP
jgi:hypothetical protein